MATPQLSLSECHRMMSAFTAAGGNKTAAAASLNMHVSTYRSRLASAQIRGVKPKGKPEKVAQKAAKMMVDSERAGRVSAEKQIAALEAEVDRLRHARKSPWKPAKVTRRNGKDDLVRVIWPDSHGMYADPVAMAVFLADMKRLAPDEVIMIGDHVDCGGFLAQHHVTGYVVQAEAYSYEQDIGACNAQLDIAQIGAPGAEWFYLEGNHEERVEKWCVQECLKNSGNTRDAEGFRRRNAPQFLLRLKERGIGYFNRHTMYDGLPIPGAIKRGKVIHVHDPGSSKPEQIALQYGCPVSYGHTHRAEGHVTTTVTAGTIGAWNPGCLARKQMFYQHSQPSRHSHGYGVELASRSGHFLRINVPIVGGVSYLEQLLSHGAKS